MTKLLITPLWCFAFFLSCTSEGTQETRNLAKDTTFAVSKSNNDNTGSIDTTTKYFALGKDSVTVLPFEIAIELSPKAKDKVVGNKETIKVNVSLTGTPKDKKLVSEDGEFYVASSEQEISYGQVAKFNSIKFSKKIFDQLTDKDANINVFFYSGRKSSSNNLLSGDIISDRISNVVNKQFTLKGKLIEGDN